MQDYSKHERPCCVEISKFERGIENLVKRFNFIDLLAKYF